MKKILEHAPLTLNIDSLDELDVVEKVISQAGRKASVGIRLCPPMENGVWSRFGLQISTGEVAEAVGRIEHNRSLTLRAIHFHLGTQVSDGTRYIEMIDIVRELWHRHHLRNDVWIDIGGGFPYDHSISLEEQPSSLSQLFAKIGEAWGPPPRPPLLVEPGRFICAPTMAVVSRVVSCKARVGEPTIIVLDSGTNHNVMAAFYEHVWSYTDVAAETRHRFCGPLCMEDDILSGERHGPQPKVGSLVAMFNAGAYSIALSRTFIQPRPPIVVISNLGKAVMIQAREAGHNLYGFRDSLAQDSRKRPEDDIQVER